VAEATTFRLDTADLAIGNGWHVESVLRTDEFSKAGVTIEVQYSADDEISSLVRSREGGADEVYGADSPGKAERLRIWLGVRKDAGVQQAVHLGKIPKHLVPKAGDWTRDEFVAAVKDPGDRAFLQRLLELVDANSGLASQELPFRLYFGRNPGGAMFVYPFGRRHPPFKFSVKDGQLLISGCWNTFEDLKGHTGFAELASMLDLDENGPATAVPVAGLDADAVWGVGETVSRAINT